MTANVALLIQFTLSLLNSEENHKAPALAHNFNNSLLLPLWQIIRLLSKSKSLTLKLEIRAPSDDNSSFILIITVILF